MAVKPTPHASPKPQPVVQKALPPPTPAPVKPHVAAATAPAPIVAPPPPVKVPLEASIKKTVSDRRNVLVINLRKENEDEVKREEEVRLGKERIALLEAEMAEIDAFLARS